MRLFSNGQEEMARPLGHSSELCSQIGVYLLRCGGCTARPAQASVGAAMPHQCPKCRTEPLFAAEGALASSHDPERAWTCRQCAGLWVPSSIVQRWRRDPFVEIVVEEGDKEEPPATDFRTGLCPHNHGILIRARVHDEEPFHVERCPHCRGIWLDEGEWQRLAADQFLDHLEDLWDPQWQSKQRAAHRQESLDRALAQALGVELFESLREAVEQLRTHPERAQALAWIADHLGERS